MLSAVNEWKVVDPVLFNDEENWVGDAFFIVPLHPTYVAATGRLSGHPL
jgi:hypothetical protein